MTLNSLPFLAFLPAVFVAFLLLGRRLQWQVLLVASYGFYASLRAPHLLVLLAVVTVLTYWAAIRLSRLADGAPRRATFWLVVGGCVGVLASAKLAPWIIHGGGAPQSAGGVVVFIGVSYFTLQAIAYVTDVYRRQQPPELHLGYHALSLAFFPKILQGPIERGHDLLPQLKAPYVPDYESIRRGAVQYTWGLFKKVVVADRLAQFVNPMYGDPASFAGAGLLVSTYLYSAQIYCDFSGYTDMAIGLGRMFNITLTGNFRAPYLSSSIVDFWRRWHITLSTWLRDYLFLPISYALSRRIDTPSVLGLSSNVVIYSVGIFVTFLLAGAWHGLSLTYVAWGALHGVYLASSSMSKRVRKSAHRWLTRRYPRTLRPWKGVQVLLTFHMVLVSWLFFRSESLSDSLYILRAILADLPRLLDLGYVRLQFRGLGLRESDLLIVGLCLVLVIIADLYANRGMDPCERLLRCPAWLRWAAYYAVLFLILYASPYSTARNYIYMQF